MQASKPTNQRSAPAEKTGDGVAEPCPDERKKAAAKLGALLRIWKSGSLDALAFGISLIEIGSRCKLLKIGSLQLKWPTSEVGVPTCQAP